MKECCDGRGIEPGVGKPAAGGGGAGVGMMVAGVALTALVAGLLVAHPIRGLYHFWKEPVKIDTREMVAHTGELNTKLAELGPGVPAIEAPPLIVRDEPGGFDWRAFARFVVVHILILAGPVVFIIGLRAKLRVSGSGEAGAAATVLLVCGLCLGLVSCKGGNDESAATRMTIGGITKALGAFKDSCGAYPTEQQGIRGLVEDPGTSEWSGPYLPAMPVDQWGRSFRYSLADGRPDVRSAGPDGKFDTADDIAGGK